MRKRRKSVTGLFMSEHKKYLERIRKESEAYEKEVQKLEQEGLTRSDAQGVVDARIMNERSTKK